MVYSSFPAALLVDENTLLSECHASYTFLWNSSAEV
jgi:hypothetical protein